MYQSNLLQKQRDHHMQTRPHLYVRSDLYQRYGKRCFDLLLCLLLFPIAFSMIALLAGLVAGSGLNPFFAQERVGRNGQIFRMWKLRTMRPHDPGYLNAYLAKNPAAQSEWQRSHKLCLDPRVTKLGRFLRCTSLDELPQILNVLSGDMSLVGPRPMLVSQQVLYCGKSYYRLRPGISGNWQVSARNRSKFVERAHFDEQYFASLSKKQHLPKSKATACVVFRATGC
jgi:exopolysaccharide production protein ExoY